MNWGVIAFNFTQLQGLLCCPYMVFYIHYSRVKGTIVWFGMDRRERERERRALETAERRGSMIE